MTGGILITGGSGLLGVNWAMAMRDRLPVTLALHRRRIALAGVATCAPGLGSVDGMLAALDAVRPAAVIHAAGLTSVEDCENDPGAAQRLNVELAENVAVACARRGVALAHISTDHLFAGETPLVDERQPVCPLNAYGRSKAAAETRVLAAHADALVVRTNFFAWGLPYRRSFSDFILDALRSGREIGLFRDVFYTPILVETAARAVHELLERHARGIVHVVGDERISKYEFGLRLARRFGLDAGLIRPALIAERAGLVRRPHDMSLSNAHARELLGRNLGGVDEQLERLQRQEQQGLATELGAL